jgi:hypothetical protein
MDKDIIELKMKTDADGLKAFKGLHARHIQKGPDVLIISTARKNLNFKTTFTPGPGAGQDLHCIIVGEIITLAVMDMEPEEWRAFADKLTERNARIKRELSAIYIEKTLQEQRAASENARLEYEKSGDPQIIIKFIKESKTGAAIQEPWINAKIQEWKRTDRTDLLKAAFQTGRGENKEPGKRAIEKMMFVNRIDKSVRAGQTLTEAFITEAERTGGGNLTGKKLEIKLTALKNKFFRAKRIKTEITIQETPEAFTMTAFPAKVTIGDSAAFGTWKFNFPKK